ncbi:MAG TPA: amidohydrolase family protein [Streptosporangiaceae bacterium]|nr:amidohydrolase family protein [Streptosporangiaceae bacterium]
MIDAHHHLWDLAAREHRWLMGGQSWATDDELVPLRRSFTLADLAPLTAAAGETGTVVIQTVAEPWETPDLLALAAGRDPYAAGKDESTQGGPAGASPGSPAAAGGLLAGVVGWTDLAAPDVREAVGRLRALPGGEFLCGIRHPVLAEADPDWLARPTVVRGLHALAETGLAFDIVTLPHQLPAAVAAARSVPELSFVLDHLGGPPVDAGEEGGDGPWPEAVRSLATLPNVTCKLSGAHSSPVRASDLRPYYETVLAAFGPGRLMFGTDWPVSTLGGTYGQVCEVYREVTAQLSAAERDAVYGRTARRVYQLDMTLIGPLSKLDSIGEHT